jgi:uncharacterized tellurite resistance protein B-like protein
MPNRNFKPIANFENSQIDALVELMLLTASADGNFATSELKQLKQNLLDIDSHWVSEAQLDACIAAASKRIAESSRNECINDIKVALPDPQQRKTALEFALSIVTADGVIRMSEHEMLVELAQKLEVDSAFAGDLILRRLF